jgi:hypothetical protein
MSTSLSACLLIVLTQVPAPADTNAEAARLLTMQAAQEYQFLVDDASQRPLTLQPTPILRWSNPVVGEIYGNVFVWTDSGRPAVVGSFLKWFSPHTHGADELHSLASGPLRVFKDKEQVWRPDKRGVEWRPLDDPPAPGASAAIRLQQLRRLSRMFSCEKTSREHETSPLRLLTQPVYRYSSPEHDVQDGAMFAFVLGTDPEAFLIIEAIDAGGDVGWQYTVARMNSDKLVMRRGDELVWETDVLPWATVKDRSRAYTSFARRDREAQRPAANPSR